MISFGLMFSVHISMDIKTNKPGNVNSHFPYLPSHITKRKTNKSFITTATVAIDEELRNCFAKFSARGKIAHK